MLKTLCIAGAGTGKTNKIITESIEEIERGGKVLVVTYTTSNQQELRQRFLTKFGRSCDHFIVKGLFSFYLEDMVRPYQQALFPQRIEGIYFNERNPHIKAGSTYVLPGRKEQLEDKSYNSNHFLTSDNTLAHTGFLAKLAARIAKKTQNAAASRLGEIYSKVYFDEVQDLVGWDYEILKVLNKSMNISMCCVGDFRQTVYDTTFGHKAPKLAADKIAAFKAMGFKEESLTLNWRCIQSICIIADTVHKGAYDKTKSAVTHIPKEINHHVGVFIVKESDVCSYISEYNPIVLRWSVASGKKILPTNVRSCTFGSSKGLGFDRVLILPSESQIQFVLDGEMTFTEDEEMAQNKMYVAITRARYSVGFIVPDKKVKDLRFPTWINPYA